MNKLKYFAPETEEVLVRIERTIMSFDPSSGVGAEKVIDDPDFTPNWENY